jgi:hypothetical protein
MYLFLLIFVYKHISSLFAVNAASTNVSMLHFSFDNSREEWYGVLVIEMGCNGNPSCSWKASFRLYAILS